jgi:tRNA(Arg) A34 adenosine deaminase TadA
MNETTGMDKLISEISNNFCCKTGFNVETSDEIYKYEFFKPYGKDQKESNNIACCTLSKLDEIFFNEIGVGKEFLHAEYSLIESNLEKNIYLGPEETLLTSLEPCTNCFTKIIYGSKIKNVFCFMRDKNQCENLKSKLKQVQQTKNMTTPTVTFCDSPSATILNFGWTFWTYFPTNKLTTSSASYFLSTIFAQTVFKNKQSIDTMQIDLKNTIMGWRKDFIKNRKKLDSCRKKNLKDDTESNLLVIDNLNIEKMFNIMSQVWETIGKKTEFLPQFDIYMLGHKSVFIPVGVAKKIVIFLKIK